MLAYRSLTLPASGRFRRGVSLLEVLVALAIFLTSLLGLGQLLTFASERALEAQQLGQATLLCQAKLAEVVAGAVPLTGSGETECEEDPDYQWAIECTETGLQGLWNVKVTVSRTRSDGTRIEAILSQLVFDPAQRGSAGESSTTTTTGGI